MPDDEAVRGMAEAYLDMHQALWPNNEQVSPDAMIAQFKDTYAGLSEVEIPQTQAGTNWGACYLRYSDANSNPRSLSQQLRNCIERANRDGVVIPWGLVFADAAITGTHRHRRGYQLIESVICGEQQSVSRFYLDELGRASRDQIDSLRLGQSITSNRRVLIGATDGYDSSGSAGKMQLQIF
ncbi:MAG: recombinase family protein, partial [Planctomycetota bacterium]